MTSHVSDFVVHINLCCGVDRHYHIGVVCLDKHDKEKIKHCIY